MKVYEGVDRLERVLDFQRDRHAVLSSNLSNVDTPGYQPLDLAEPASDGGAAQLYTDTTTTPGVDGNAVSMERELAKIDANRVRYNAASELVSRKLALLRYTSSDGQP